MKIPQKYRDLLARAAWQASLGFVSIISTPAAVQAIDGDVKAHIPTWVAITVPSVGALFSAVKSFIGTKVGDPDSVTLNGPKDKAVREAAKAIVEGTAQPIPQPSQPLDVTVPAPPPGAVPTAPFSVIPTGPPIEGNWFERPPSDDPAAVLPQGDPITSFDPDSVIQSLMSGGPPAGS